MHRFCPLHQNSGTWCIEPGSPEIHSRWWMAWLMSRSLLLSMFTHVTVESGKCKFLTSPRSRSSPGYWNTFYVVSVSMPGLPLLFIHGATRSMEFSSWWIISRLAGQEILRSLYRIRLGNMTVYKLLLTENL
jgi:hypothetical protein